MATLKTYRGYSTIDAERTRAWTLTDIALVKRDLYNHFQTRLGERVMRPEFGCRIWDYLFEQSSPALRQDIRNEAVRVVQADPRVNLINVDLIEYAHGVRVEITLDFISMGVVDTMQINFERDEAAKATSQLQEY